MELSILLRGPGQRHTLEEGVVGVVGESSRPKITIIRQKFGPKEMAHTPRVKMWSLPPGG